MVKPNSVTVAMFGSMSERYLCLCLYGSFLFVTQTSLTYQHSFSRQDPVSRNVLNFLQLFFSFYTQPFRSFRPYHTVFYRIGTRTVPPNVLLFGLR